LLACQAAVLQQEMDQLKKDAIRIHERLEALKKAQEDLENYAKSLEF
jgi:hypothetical protein